jgi:UDP-N-acetyl-D-mannosaminuronic acid dehydrogenase
LVENDRIIGGMTDICSKAAVDLYKLFVEGTCVSTDVRAAEMCKLVENSFRDVNIAFANELSVICEKLDIDVWELIQLANKHPRVNILQPGCGVGGHCIAVDPWFIISQVPDDAHLIKTARNVNEKKPVAVFDKIVSEAKAKHTRDIAILGITYKPNIDDIRESPAIKVVKMLCEAGFNVKVFEPNLATLPTSLTQSGIEMIASLEDVINSKNCVSAVLVAHEKFEVASSDLMAISVLDFCGLTNG